MITTIAIVAGSTADFAASLVGYASAMGEAHDAFSFDDERIREVAGTGCRGVTHQLSDSVGDRQTRIAKRSDRSAGQQHEGPRRGRGC